jgi:outer membrane protein OmpA-like peptidoglycan-associated protein
MPSFRAPFMGMAVRSQWPVRAIATAVLILAPSVSAPASAQPPEPPGSATVAELPPQRDELAPAIYFDPDSATVTADAMPLLRRWAAYLLQRSPTEKLRLQGHADARGDRDYNKALAEQRAMAVLQALVALGVQRERLEVASAGEQSPQAFGQTEFAWSRNRRVELELE